MSPSEVSPHQTAEYYEAEVGAAPVQPGVPTHLPQSVMHQEIPGSPVLNRRTAYPQRTEQTRKYRQKLTPAEYIKKKTFERPAYFAIEDPVETNPPFPMSHRVPGPAGNTTQGVIKITQEADFECVKIMSNAFQLVEGVITLVQDYLINFKDLASGRDFNNVPIHVRNFGGNANEPLILPVTLFLNRNSSVVIEFTTLVAEDIYIYFTLLGIKYYYPDALNLTTGIPEAGNWKHL
jgi:hypothetical protein